MEMGSSLLGESRPVTVFLLPVIGDLEEGGASSAFEFVDCGTCGSSYRRQVADLQLYAPEPPPPAVTTTIQGDLVLLSGIGQELKTLGAEVELRAASVENDSREWLQVVPEVGVEPRVDSLREAWTPCHECGGVARVSYGDVALRGVERDLPLVGFVRGAPLMVTLKGIVLELFQRHSPTFYADEMDVTTAGEV